MVILGIETSCDETAASVVRDGREILSNVVASSAEMHVKTGGIIPERAAREQVRSIMPVVDAAMTNAKCQISNLDSLAVTAGGPGLIGSMLVGVETAKTLAYVWDKPIVPVVHLLAHVYANWLEPENRKQKTESRKEPKLPAVILTVAGGHTDLILMQDHGKFKWLGGTRDDAAGETFDKVARLLGLPYPGGPSIQKASLSGKVSINFPRPLKQGEELDFSFSGLKTSVLNFLKQNPNANKNDVAAGVQEAIADVLSHKALLACRKYKAESLAVAGGVAANQRLKELLKARSPVPVFIPPPRLCTDNATFIASYAFFNFQPRPWQEIVAIPDPYEAMKTYANIKA